MQTDAHVCPCIEVIGIEVQVTVRAVARTGLCDIVYGTT